MIRFDTSELGLLDTEFKKAAKAALPALRGVVQESASELKDDWRARARISSGAHGKHYPNSITYETRQLAMAVEGEVGPDPSKAQGSMAFETGSVNQPPHPDGQMSADNVVPKFHRRMDAAIAHLGL